ncbi:MAG TPA: tRNA pseudouridine(38-40) synthase TruA [Bacilli bacterium]|nr:tRNA pseudouridine(38-40) synthase TruA [Bacilli bacterium]
MRYLITFSYDGTNYSGYQRQLNHKTIQGEIENALNKISGGEYIKLCSSGRTDKGVHAINQKAHFDLNKKITLYKLRSAINRYIDNDIYVKDIKIVPNDFHARYMVRRKIYTYKINTSDYNPLERYYIYQYNKPLNIKKIKQQVKYLIGTHDFSSFANKEEKKESYIRTIYKIKVNYKSNILSITFIGNGFLKYQVRNMVGALIDVSNSKKGIKTILEAKDRSLFGKIAPSEGLYLEDVKY